MNRLALIVGSVALLGAVANAQEARPANTDIYHIHFAKAALGQTKALENDLKMQDPKAPMPGHILVLRHQEGDDWDYAVIEHLGKKYTIDPTTMAPPSTATPALGDWHTDTFASGPSWDVFEKEMGITDAAKAGSVYVVATWRAAPGHRQDMEKAMNARDANSKVQTGNVTLRHLEGGPWNIFTMERYNSWQDFAADEAATQDSAAWYEIRKSGAWHHDTITTRVATSGK